MGCREDRKKTQAELSWYVGPSRWVPRTARQTRHLFFEAAKSGRIRGARPSVPIVRAQLEARRVLRTGEAESAAGASRGVVGVEAAAGSFGGRCCHRRRRGFGGGARAPQRCFEPLGHFREVLVFRR